MSENKLSTRDLADTADREQAEKHPAASEGGQTTQQPRAADAHANKLGSNQTVEDVAVTRADSGRDSSRFDQQGSLLPQDQTSRFTDHWQEIQGSFVDQPREAVEQADALVADLMQRLAAGFSNERERLEAQWDRGDDVSTEDLRVALTRYRSFFDRLLSA